MTTATRIVGFVAGLAALFGLALGLGRVVGPVGEPAAAHEGASPDSHTDDSADDAAGADHGTAPARAASAGADVPGGLMVSQDGYGLRLASATASAGQQVPVAFTVTGPDGKPVTGYEVQHEKQLHLIAVRRDFTGFQHVHPTLAPDGTWSAALDLEPGTWRLFADFKPSGADALTLGADLGVPGAAALAEPVSETRTVHVDGYTVTVAGDLVAGRDAKLTLSVTKDGKPVTDLEPYLGAYGHLVALREGDLAYLHVHPDGEPGDGRTQPGPEVVFHAAVPSPGAYRLYLDFQHDGVVRTAPLAVTAEQADGTAGSPAPSDDQSPAPDHSGDDHS
ncbi:MAG TPA: hypothetical protein VJN29_10545 [Intrasporangium sp.]|uniref:hypothetical protein n=1 Tax=Intrasporangium sp. TaxID=1925024 RepID=UPI002B45DCB8|nr:hypothetical protein [Intrasporangium sp.]HKX67653.1 hypothetical protein [Intrasporangium sp.]